MHLSKCDECNVDIVEFILSSDPRTTNSLRNKIHSKCSVRDFSAKKELQCLFLVSLFIHLFIYLLDFNADLIENLK